MLCYHTLFQDPVLKGTALAPTSQIRASDMLLLTVGTKKYKDRAASNGKTFIRSFIKIHQLVKKLRRRAHTHARTHARTHTYIQRQTPCGSHKPTFFTYERKVG
jgi:hypothetical protein